MSARRRHGWLALAALLALGGVGVPERDAAARPTLPDSATAARRVPVEITAYCLRGRTARGNPVRKGIAAADPKVFPLGSTIELRLNRPFEKRTRLGRFLIDDTGGAVRGPIVDIWMPSCKKARQFGRRRGTAVIVARPRR